MKLQQTMYALIEKQARSNQSIGEFCDQHQISYAKFHYWRKKKEQHNATPPVQEFIQINPKPDPTAGQLTLSLPDGSQLTGSTDQLALFYHQIQQRSHA